jgi:hypothetical protein
MTSKRNNEQSTYMTPKAQQQAIYIHDTKTQQQTI